MEQELKKPRKIRTVSDSGQLVLALRRLVEDYDPNQELPRLVPSSAAE
jgi:hypothetical protein